jgi:hypothetical protein
MESHLNSLQDVVRLTIRQELTWSEQRFKRVTMSQDADGKPAELYGADGKIYYRKAGGAGVEIGAGVGGLWEISGTKIAAISNRPVIHDIVWLKDEGAGNTSDLTWWVELGGGGGGHPDEEPEV